MMAITSEPQTPYDWTHEEIKDDDTTTGGRYLGALVLLAGITPLFFLASIITLIVYLSPSPLPHLNPSSPSPLHFVEFLDLIGVLALLNWLGPVITILIIGLIITLIIWLLLAIPCRRFASAKGGRSSDYNGLKTQYRVLVNRFEYLRCEDDQTSQHAGKSATSTGQAKARDIAIADISGYLGDFAKTLKRDGLNWVLYTGYVAMWDRLNKAEEAMIDLMPLKTVIETAMYDNKRLYKSDVPDNDARIEDLEADINTLRPQLDTSDTESSTTTAAPTPGSSATPSAPTPMSSTTTAAKEPKKRETAQEAINDIRHVRCIIHKFNNERWDELVRARNQLMGTAFLTAFFIYIMLVIALVAKIPQTNIKQAIVFYLIGAGVGLFSRLFSEFTSKARVKDDYGLSMARILVTPLYSGLAVLIGVLLFTSASGTLEKIYEFNIQNLAIAAVIGYAPNIVINKLQANQQKIHSEITSTTVADQGSASGSAGNGSNVGSSNKSPS